MIATRKLSCPLPLRDYPKVTLAHGGGGSLTKELIDTLFAPVFNDPQIDLRHDGAVIPSAAGSIAFSTDTHVVNPLSFPGGDIGKLAVCGTVNDLAMCGACHALLSVGFVIEEGLPMDTLVAVVDSMKTAATKAGARIVTGDTKVVDRGKGDGIYINTSGVGSVHANAQISPRFMQAEDVILLSGDVGRHGVAVMAARDGLEFETDIESDCAPLAPMVEALLDASIPIHCLRDLTRGGLATCLVELAESSGRSITIAESQVPVLPGVEAACELLGLDPLYVANEGRCIVVLPAPYAEEALSIMKQFPEGAGAVRIGDIGRDNASSLVQAITPLGTRRLLFMLSGEQLPRIC